MIQSKANKAGKARKGHCKRKRKRVITLVRRQQRSIKVRARRGQSINKV